MGEFILVLLHAATNAHLLHFRSKSNAEHMFLGKFYEKLPKLVDMLVEAAQGREGVIYDYPVQYYPPAETALEELTMLKDYVDEERQKPEILQDSEIQNLIDGISELIDTTIYKIKFLK